MNMFRAAFSLLIPVLTAMSAAAAESGVNGSTGNNGTTGSSTMTDPYANFNTLREQNQGLFLWEGNARFETPGSVNIDFRIVQWWCSFEFTSTNLLFDGYYARSVEIHLDDVEKEITEQGAGDVYDGAYHVASVAAVYVPQLKMFQGKILSTADSWVTSFYDDGSPSMPAFSIESNDEAFSLYDSYAAFGQYTILTIDDAAALLGVKASDVTPEACINLYNTTWNYLHTVEALPPLVSTANAKAKIEAAAAAGVEAAVEDTSSGSKNGLFVFLSAFAAVGIAAVLGDVLAL